MKIQTAFNSSSSDREGLRKDLLRLRACEIAADDLGLPEILDKSLSFQELLLKAYKEKFGRFEIGE